MKAILVVGGAGEVGEGIARQLLANGHRVIIQSRSAAKLAEIKALLGESDNLVTLTGEIGTENQIQALRAAIKAEGLELDSVVASVGSWWSGPQLVDLDLNTFQKVMDERLVTHFLIAKTFLPDLIDRPGSSYTFIHGAAGFIPIPNSGPVSIAGAAQLMLKDVFVKELSGSQVRINLLSMMGAISTRSHPSVDPESLTALDVGNFVSYLVDAREVRDQTIKFSHRRELPKK